MLQGHFSDELHQYMFADNLADLKLSEHKIGYTFKTMGAGFWALRQENFRAALQDILLEVPLQYNNHIHFETS